MFKEFKLGIFHFIYEVGPQGLELPPFYGSTFRGAFGSAFRQIACANQSMKACHGCMLEQNCPYAYIFETSSPNNLPGFPNYDDVPRPFVFCPELKGRTHFAAGELLIVEVRVFGKALSYLPYFVLAFIKMGEKGLGYKRRPVILKEVVNVNPLNGSSVLVYDASENKMYQPPKILTGDMLFEHVTMQAERVTINLQTPLRIKENGDLVRSVEFNHIARSLLRRASAIMKVHHDANLDINFSDLAAKSHEVKRIKDFTKWHDLTRYSQRQGTKMKLGGVIGEVSYQGEISEYLPLLEFGRWVGLGKSTVFGLGQMDYKVMD